MSPFVLGIVGDSGSGKSTLAGAVARLLGPERTTDLHLDDYHRFSREERAARGVTSLNPMVHNLSLMREHLQLLRQGRPIRNRSYDHADGTFGPIRGIEAREVVLVRGLLGFPAEETRALHHLAVFVQPEPELLLRWKLRRDVHARGYTEAEVLKYITHHLLDSKQFVLPQARRADVVIRHHLPQWDAPDREILTSLLLRREAAELGRADAFLGPAAVGVTRTEEEDGLALSIHPELPEEAVDAWGRESFPERYEPAEIGWYTDDEGEPARRPQLAFTELFVARAAETLRHRS